MRRETYLKIRALGFRSYAEYLGSPHWSSVRARYKKSKHPWKCYVCGKSTIIVLHHWTYERIGKERLTDLIPLCPKHHRGLHLFMKHRRTKLEVAHPKYKAWVEAGSPPKKRKKPRKKS